MFSDDYCLTQAVLDGTKTMTRRVERLKLSARMFDEALNIEGGLNDKGRWIFTLYNKNGDIIGDIIPHYNIGEVVAIAQSYHTLNKSGYTAPEWLDHVCESSAGYENKMFVRADLMPHHIKITDVKVERLQDISEDEILREGVWQFPGDKFTFYISKTIGKYKAKAFSTARDAYKYLIDKVSGKGTWENNPWVVAYSFELVD